MEPPARPRGTALALQAWGPQSGIASLAMDDSGVQVLAGSWSGTFTVDGQDFTTVDADEDAFVAVFEPDGSLRWFVQFAGDQPAQTMAEIGASGDVVVVGNFDSELLVQGSAIEPGPLDGSRALFFAQLDGATGTLEWAYTMTNDVAYSGHPLAIAAVADGGMVAATSAGIGSWTFQGEEVIEASTATNYLVRLDSDGAKIWDAGVFGVDDTVPVVGAIDVEDDAVVVAIEAGSLEATASVYLDPTVYSSGYARAGLIVRYDPTGAVDEVYVPQADMSIRALALGPCGDLVFGGRHSGGFDLGTGLIDGNGGYVARRTLDGEMRWVVPLDADGDVYATVSGVIFDDAGQTVWQAFDGQRQRILRLDSEGTQIWELAFDSVWNYALYDAIAGDGLDRISIGSSYYDALAVPGLPAIPADGENHGFLLDIAP